MADKKPLVIQSGEVRQLQGADDLDIPLKQRVDDLESALNTLIAWMSDQGFELSNDLIDRLKD